MDFKNNTLKSIESIFGDEYLIEEKIPLLKWELIDETKMIDSVSVSKAVCEFRGRKYIAWYSLDYPLKYGPWKLQGLPGLIFEVYDETKRYNWIIKKISHEFIDENKSQIQCVVANPKLNLDSVNFGEAQYPKLDDYADKVNTMRFLEVI